MDMQVALDPRTLAKTTFEQFRRDHRRNENDRMGDRLERAKCPACRGDLKEVNGATARRIPHFSHKEGNSGCWLVTRGRQPFLDLFERTTDPRAAFTIRDRFRRNWRRHYKLIYDLVDAFNVKEFFRLIKEADDRDIWSYRDIEEWAIPYAMLMFCDFSPKTGQTYPGGANRREEWHSFYFRARRRDEALWIREPESTELIHMIFVCRPGARRRPGADDLKDFIVVEFDRDFVVTGREDVPASISRGVEAWFHWHWPRHRQTE